MTGTIAVRGGKQRVAVEGYLNVKRAEPNVAGRSQGSEGDAHAYLTATAVPAVEWDDGEETQVVD